MSLAGWFGVAEQGSAAGCQRVFLPAGTWITRFSCRWPTGSSLPTSGRQVRPDRGHREALVGLNAAPKWWLLSGWRGQPPGEGCLGCWWFPCLRRKGRDIPQGMLKTPKSAPGGGMHPLPAAGIPWGHQLMSLLMGDLKTGISSHHIPSAGSRRGFLGDALTTHPTPADRKSVV